MGKIAKVVIDTNVFISGFGWDGKPEEVLNLLEKGDLANFITTEIFEEIKRVVSYPKLKFSSSLQTKIIEFVFSYSRFVRMPEGLLRQKIINQLILCKLASNKEKSRRIR
ncbi:MAG: putative toxin-antitoxin system toxin component, PIN family [Deltaproteobacteria bacterium]|nr:putative toxin-antitoxin system toxin component, PIN family [Deltaproteobacteria bacterium]